MIALLDDIRVALRRLAAHPWFTIITVVSLGLGVGANATVFSGANALLIKPLEVPHAAELARVYRGRHSPFPFRVFDEIRSQSRAFSSLFAEAPMGASLARDGDPERVRASLVTGNIFAALELVPAAGRLFAHQDDRTPGPAPEVVLSHAYWQRLGSDPSVVGSTVRVNARAFQVIGVAPPGFSSSLLGSHADIFVAIRDSRALVGVAPDSLPGSMYVAGRLASGRRVADAEAELSVIAAQLRRGPLVDENFTVRVRPARGIVEELRLPATVASGFLLAVSLLVLTIASTNVGNLMLARNAARRRELGVRLALGAPSGRIVRLLLAEAGVLAVGAGIVAMLIAAWVTPLLSGLVPADAEVRFDLTPDWRVVVFTGVAAGMALLIFGMLPARHAARRDVIDGIKDTGPIGGSDGTRLRRRFLLAQVALCSVLLATASLFVRSLAGAGSVDIGFRPEGVVIADIDLGGRPLDATQRAAFFQRVLGEVKQVPGVEVATYSMIAELTGSNAETVVLPQGMDSTQGRQTYLNVVGPDYHRTLGIPLVRGRDFSESDVAASQPVAIVNETFAARVWPSEEPIGKRFSLDGPAGPWHEVIGLSRNVRYHSLGEEAKMFATVPLAQVGAQRAFLEVRVAGGADGRAVGKAIVGIVRTLDPALAPPVPRPMTEAQRIVLLPAQFGAGMLGAIGALGFLLAAVGVAGVAAYTVTQRTREIGVRVALGAQPLAVVRGVLQDVLRTVAVGSVLGLVLAVGVGKLIERQLYGVSFADPVTLVVVPLLLVAMALGAVALPARRAIEVEPVEALRSE